MGEVCTLCFSFCTAHVTIQPVTDPPHSCIADISEAVLTFLLGEAISSLKRAVRDGTPAPCCLRRSSRPASSALRLSHDLCVWGYGR